MTDASIAGRWDEAGGSERRAGYRIVRATWPSPAARERVATAYLGDAEQAALARLAPAGGDDRLRGRVAVKDAVRAWMAGRGVEGIAPRDVRVDNDATGRPVVRIAGRPAVVGAPAVSIAHRRPAAVAVAGAPGAAVGIDVELVERRGSVFARLALRTAELRLGEAAAVGRDEWVTRLWTVKEAVAKAAGTGLRGRPKDFVVHEVDGEWARATGPGVPGGLWVRSSREDDLVVSVVARRGDPCGDA